MLLRNRLAYLIGKNPSDRNALLKDFDEIYKVRSQIVHRGKARLSMKKECCSAVSATCAIELFNEKWTCCALKKVTQVEKINSSSPIRIGKKGRGRPLDGLLPESVRTSNRDQAPRRHCLRLNPRGWWARSFGTLCDCGGLTNSNSRFSRRRSLPGVVHMKLKLHRTTSFQTPKLGCHPCQNKG